MKLLLSILICIYLPAVGWGAKKPSGSASPCNLLMAKLLTHGAQSGTFKEEDDFFFRTWSRFPFVFDKKVGYLNELRNAFQRSEVVKDLGLDETMGHLYLFEGKDFLERTWQFTFRVGQGDMTSDGKIISANPASFLPFSDRESSGDVIFHEIPWRGDDKELTVVTNEIFQLAKVKEVVITGHIYQYMSERKLSEVDLFHILKTGQVKAFLGSDTLGTPRYRWLGKDTSGNPYRLIVGLGDKKIFIISAAPYDHNRIIN